MKLRLATSRDAQMIAAIHAASWQITYRDALSADYLQRTALADREAVWAERFASPKENQCVLIAEDSSGVIGFTCAYAAENGVRISTTFMSNNRAKGKELGRHCW